MNREQLQRMVIDCDHGQDKIRERLEAHFDTKEGQTELAKAPRCMAYYGVPIGDNDGLPGMKIAGQQTTKDLVIKLLMQEVESW